MFSPHWLHNSLLYCNTDKGPEKKKIICGQRFCEPSYYYRRNLILETQQLIKKHNILPKHVAVRVLVGETFKTIAPQVLKNIQDA